jgi:hypothetical protein
MREQRNIHPGERVDGVGKQLGVLGGVVEIGDGGAPCAAQMRQVASAMPEVAPSTRIFLVILVGGTRAAGSSVEVIGGCANPGNDEEVGRE